MLSKHPPVCQKNSISGVEVKFRKVHMDKTTYALDKQKKNEIISHDYD